MSVYFVVCDHTEMVKIGHSGNPEKRTRSLQATSSFPLKLHATIDGARNEEAALHERFVENRVFGEWFLITGELKKYLSELEKYEPPEKPERKVSEVLKITLDDDDLSEIERRATASRISVAELCDLAEIAYSTWWRWKKGGTVSIKKFRLLEQALTKREAA